MKKLQYLHQRPTMRGCGGLSNCVILRWWDCWQVFISLPYGFYLLECSFYGEMAGWYKVEEGETEKWFFFLRLVNPPEIPAIPP